MGSRKGLSKVLDYEMSWVQNSDTGLKVAREETNGNFGLIHNEQKDSSSGDDEYPQLIP